MKDSSRNDIRRLLKNFGIQADEAMIAHLANNPDTEQLHIQLVMKDLTDYGDSPPAEVLELKVEGQIRRREQ